MKAMPTVSSRAANSIGAPTQVHPRMTLFGLLVLSLQAFGDDGMTITINNNTTRNLLVTVTDQVTHQKIVSSQTINGFASITVMVTPDETGSGHLSWAAVTSDPDMRMCGRNDKGQLKDHDTVNVYANAECNPGS